MAYNIWDTCFFVPGLKVSDCASWIQAWGTVLAIGGAIWVGRRQVVAAHTLEAERRNRHDLLKTEIAMTFFSEAAFVSDQLANLEKSSEALESEAQHVGRLQEIEQAFRQLPPFELPGRRVAAAVLEAPKALADLRQAAAACIHWREGQYGDTNFHVRSAIQQEFQRAQMHASGVCHAGIETRREQLENVRRLLPDID